MLKVKIEKTKNMGGSGIYWSQNTWNIKGDNQFYTRLSIAFHLFNRVFRLYWVTDASV